MIKKVSTILAVSAAFSMFAQGAGAAEFWTPMQPGVTTGTPVAALPPPGLYGDLDSYEMSGPVKNGNGDKIGVKLSGYEILASLLYVPGWKILGANYGMGIVQPFNWATVDERDVGGRSYGGGGFFNTVLQPEMLSWNLGGGNFLGEGFGVYFPDGRFEVSDGKDAPTSIANNFYTFEPNVAYSYLGGGWDITLNNTFDFNTTDNATHYHTGDIYYLDWTLAHSFGPVTVGAIGNYVQQFTDDTQFGLPVANTGGSGGYGNRYMDASVGPMLAYHFGHGVTLTLRYLQGFASENGGNPSFFHIGVSFPIS